MMRCKKIAWVLGFWLVTQTCSFSIVFGETERGFDEIFSSPVIKNPNEMDGRTDIPIDQGREYRSRFFPLSHDPPQTIDFRIANSRLGSNSRVDLPTTQLQPHLVTATPLGPLAPGGPIRREGAIEPTPLEDVLMEEGVISDDQWLRIKAYEEERLDERTEASGFPGSPRWYERLRLSGWAELRYNRLGQPNEELISWQDRSVGKRLGDNATNQLLDPTEPSGFVLRRARLTVSGQVSEHVAVKFQPDFATTIDSNTHSLAMRDAWAQYYFDKDKEWRFRAGLQKVPCSFEMWQSSSRRISIDRADATASCQRDNRDLALSVQWTPTFAQHRWKRMVDYLFGAGDWGMINFTVYNGQGGNEKERNSDKHFGFRFAYPFELPGGRLLEIGMNANTGMFSVDPGTPSLTKTELFSFNQNLPFINRKDYRDQRANFYVYYPPQPWGILAEFVTGRGPIRDSTGIIRERSLQGGYVQGQYMWKYSDMGLANFYVKWQEYQGGLKWATGAPDVSSEEFQIGVAWLPDPQWEWTLEFSMAQRKNFERTRGFATGTCSTAALDVNPNDGTANPNPFSTTTPNNICSPDDQFTARAMLIRMQLQWYFN